MLAYIFLALAVVFLIIYVLSTRTCKSEQLAKSETVEIKQIQKESHGRVRIYFGSQTGTAAKLSQQLSEEAAEQGFQPEVIDLKDLKINHFESINEVSLFLLSNTGEGDPPENTIKFVKVLKGKESLDEVKDVNWKRINYSVFGLGNTQYEHYNKTGIEVDGLFEKKGAKRIYKIGLGDDNCSLEDDFAEWKKDLWSTLKEFRKSNPFKELEHEEKAMRKISSELNESFNYISKAQPLYANYKLFFKSEKDDFIWHEDDLDFKTKASLKAELGAVKSTRELRQNLNDGSTLQIEVELPNQPLYQTAGNIALYSKNDPRIIEEIAKYFQISQQDLDRKVGLTKLKQDKKIKLNFVPNTFRNLLSDSIDIQGKLSKSVLKKLAKFQSKNPSYFTENSLKTTKEFERITDEKEWYTLIRIIRQFQVKLTFEDFVELSDSMAPRLFTIASHAKTQKNVIVAASLVENGLISKNFLAKPEYFLAELRKSTFTDAMQWKKIILVATGTGLAPFRAFIQQKIYNIKQKSQGKDVNVPLVTLFFGCKHEHGDFIYKDEILEWKNSEIINRLHMAFSRDTQKKIYVQDLLKNAEEELKELGHCEDTAVYICGSLPMGKSIIEALTESLGAQKVKQMQQKGRIVKQLW